MLSIGRLVSGAERYYLRTVAQGREEYYTGSGEAPGIWVGRGAARLGLEGVVEPGELSAVLAGMSPEGKVLGTCRTDPARRVAGLDLTFSAPKSVSLLYGLGEEETATTVRTAHAEAVEDALGYLERRALRVRRGAGGAERLGAEGFVATSFLHRTSRADDPQLHTHVLVANLAYGDDGAWSAPYARLLYHHARTAGFLYQASLRARLTDALGVRFGPVEHGMAELDGFPKSVLRAFSTRRREIEAHLDDVGARSARAAEVAALVTRVPKVPVPGAGADEGLRARWRAQADALGLSSSSIAGLLGRHVRSALAEEQSASLVARLVGTDGLTATSATFERRDAVRAVAELFGDGATVAEVERVADRVLVGTGVVALPSSGRGGERRHTTEELLSVERRAVESACSRVTERVAVVPRDLVDAALEAAAHLGADQRAMVQRLVTSGAGVDVVVGKAGSGKTAALAAARAAWESAGHRVCGAALSARAAKGLEDGAGIESQTIARLERALAGGTATLRVGDVLVVDEAGMVGTRTLARLLDAAERAGTKVVLVGDPRQLPEIDAGGAFGALARRLGAVELTEIRRQREVWEREALDELREGHPFRALASFVDEGRVVVAPDITGAREALVARWHEGARRGEDDALMLAVTRRDVEALNVAARRALRDAGILGEDLARFGDLGLAKGDVVVCLKNDRTLGVLNGTRGSVAGIEGGAVALDTPEGTWLLPAAYASAHLAYGYALTVHKAQGATVERAYVLASESLTKEAGYVALSRARRGTELFAAAGIEDGLDCEQHTPDDSDALARVGARLSVSKAKQLALDELDTGGSAGDVAQDWVPRAARLPVVVSSRPARAVGGASRVAAMTWITGAELPGPVRRAIGAPPPPGEERAVYDRVAAVLSSYRARFGVDGDDLLGPLPLEATRRAAYETARRELFAYERRLGRTREFSGIDLGS